MAKKIFVDENTIELLIEQLKAKYGGTRCYSGSLTLSAQMESNDSRATIRFTAPAWSKMIALVMEFSTEVQWHGLVRRINDTTFEVYDIITFPHEVSAATVVSEFEPYQKWRDELPDEVFNAEHFHGHSHVNMAVAPSSTDAKYRKDLVTQLPVAEGMDSFYLFMIVNKHMEWSGQIFDLKNNAMYDEKNIDLDVQLGDTSLAAFIGEAKANAVTRTTPATTYPVTGVANYGSHGAYGTSGKNTRRVNKNTVKETSHFDDDDDDWFDYYGGRY